MTTPEAITNTIHLPGSTHRLITERNDTISGRTSLVFSSGTNICRLKIIFTTKNSEIQKMHTIFSNTWFQFIICSYDGSMTLFNYHNLSYGLSVVTFVTGSAEWKNMGMDGSSTSHVWLIRQALETIPLTGEWGWFVMFIFSSENFLGTGCKILFLVCVSSHRSFLCNHENTSRQRETITNRRTNPNLAQPALQNTL